MSKKIKCGILTFSLAAIVASTAALSACTIKTKHPRAEITVNFNNVDYQIEYTLYRNMYPQTVQHFIELADSEFYNNMIIHDYRASDWFTGSYKYDATSDEGYISSATNNALGEYLENNSKEADYYALAGNGTLTPTVFKQVTYDKNNKPQVVAADALPTLIGEFSQNDHNIDKGALTARTGSLKMFYYSKGESNQKAAIKNSFGQIMEHDYAYNCATSVFSMQVSSGSSFTATNYCVFGELRNDTAQKTLEKLLDAVDDYIADVLGGSSSKFTSSVKTEVDNLDTFAEEGGRGIETTFTMTSTPIVIKSVKITKY